MLSSLFVATMMTVKVMVVDVGYTPTPFIKHKVTYQEGSLAAGHGTTVAIAILNYDIDTPDKIVCDRVEVTFCGAGLNFGPDRTIACLDKAIKEGFHYVNMSFSGDARRVVKEEEMFKKASDAGVVIAIAAGNSRSNLDIDKVYPQEFARYMKNVHTMSAYDVLSTSKGSYTIGSFSGLIKGVDDVGSIKQWSGTSFAAPRFINQELRRRCLSNRRVQ